MDWRDDGILLSTRPLGEANAIAELLTEGHGRHLGLVRGGRSRRLRPLLQPSNLLHITWRARLPEHLGSITVELMQSYAAGVLDDPAALLGIESLTSMARMLPERDPHPALYHGARAVFDALDDPEIWPARLVRWELEFLADMGFGIDLSECAATGTTDDLIYVSPKSGRAVSREAGEPYADKLLRLPAFLIDEAAEPSPQDIADGFRLSGYFLDRDIYSPHGEPLPAARERLLARLAQS
ncbi:DNA repair protein RecO [Methyloligella halotolerans]|uniref:DNA repair protein RecO n=1 Tax=Methyloligella halotolerans TaxID=1177755 RepID=A0A1E2S2I1_9HYPH|nr:DNA repair protein RecO [Methyloligella halotolerans]ODA68590.1 DNA repair protein RecO [Methyloligella halotolerans]